MGIRRRAARRVVFVVRQEIADLNGDVAPLRRWIRVKNIRQGSPARVPDEESFLFFRRFAVPGFDPLESADRGDVVAGLFLQPALADTVSILYPEVARRGRRFRFRLDFPEGGGAFGGRSSPGRNAHSRVAISHAA